MVPVLREGCDKVAGSGSPSVSGTPTDELSSSGGAAGCVPEVAQYR